MPTAVALVARLVTVLAVVAAVLCCLHPSAGTLAQPAPVVTLQRVPAPPLPAVRHCWVEHKADADGGDETVEGDPAQAAPYSTPVPCSS